MDKSKEQKCQMYTKIDDRIAVFLLLILLIAVFITVFMLGKASEQERVVEYNARLEKLCEWIDGYEIVNVEDDYEVNPSLTFIWTLTRLNNGIEETITVEDDAFKTLKGTCPIDSNVRVSPDNKYHIVEADNKLVIYRPSNDYYDTLSKSKYSSK
jgi:hypothetical protein